ncbi:hypothetical protein FB451DRAFT_1195344 [Mycena latifolia]|nr:hypothetical protein FB451DRAFT_1195344 [Mycena latifolia]
MSSQSKEFRCNILLPAPNPVQTRSAKLAEEVYAEERGLLSLIVPVQKKGSAGAPPYRRHMAYTTPFSLKGGTGRIQDIAFRPDETVSATSNNSAGGRREGETERRDRRYRPMKEMAGRGSGVKARRCADNRSSARRRRRMGCETAPTPPAAKARMRNATAAAPRRAGHPPHSPTTIPRKRRAPAALVGGGGDGAEELAGAVVVLDPTPEFDAVEEEADAEVDDGTNDGKERDAGFVAAERLDERLGGGDFVRVRGEARDEAGGRGGDEMHRGTTQKQLTTTSEEQFATSGEPEAVRHYTNAPILYSRRHWRSSLELEVDDVDVAEAPSTKVKARRRGGCGRSIVLAARVNTTGGRHGIRRGAAGDAARIMMRGANHGPPPTLPAGTNIVAIVLEGQSGWDTAQI